MKVIGYDQCIDRERALDDSTRLVSSSEELLSSSDFISINECLTEETREMSGKSGVSSMKNGVYVVDTTRGEIVDERAIIEGSRIMHAWLTKEVALIVGEKVKAALTGKEWLHPWH